MIFQFYVPPAHAEPWIKFKESYKNKFSSTLRFIVEEHFLKNESDFRYVEIMIDGQNFGGVVKKIV